MGTFKNSRIQRHNLQHETTSWTSSTSTISVCLSLRISLNPDLFAVSPQGWRVLVESPDKLATLTKSNIFTEDSQVQVWADELKTLLVEKVGSRFGAMKTCFFSDCCGYEYTNNQVRPTPLPRVLFDMLAKLMPACGIYSKDMWPNGVNVNYYPDG